MGINPKWTPMQWRCGPIAAERTSTSGGNGAARSQSQRTAEQYTDPSMLGLLDGSPIDCLVVDWAAGGDLDAAQQKALQPLIEAGRRKGISFVGRVMAKEGLLAIVSAGLEAGLEALLLPGPAPEGLALPAIALFSRENVDWDHVSDTFVLSGNVWPGAVLSASQMHNPSHPQTVGAPHTEPAGPTQDPWVDSNGWVSLLARGLTPAKTLWLEFDPPASDKMLPAEKYCLAVADARASGSRWIIDLDEPMRAALATYTPEAIAAWKQIARMDAFFDRHPQWAEGSSVGVLTVVSDFRGDNAAMSNEVLNLLKRQHVQFIIADRMRPLAPHIAGRRAVLWVDDTEPTPEQCGQLMQFVAQGGLVIAPKYWGPKDITPRTQDWLFGYDIYPMGKGRIVVATGGFPDPFHLGRDTHLLVGHVYDAFRLFNPGTAGCFIGSETTEHKEIVQVLNYNAPQPVDYLTLWIHHPASAAKLWSVGNSAPLTAVAENGGSSFDLPPIDVYCAVEIERQA